MNDFKRELEAWAASVKIFTSQSNHHSSKIRRILKKQFTSDANLEPFVNSFGSFENIYLDMTVTLFSDNFFVTNESKLLRSMFAVDSYLGRDTNIRYILILYS